MLEAENALYIPKGRQTNFKLATGMEYDDNACLPIIRQRKVAEAPKLAERLSVPRLTFYISSKVRRSEVSVTRPLWVAVHRTCKGRGHIVAAALLVILITV